MRCAQGNAVNIADRLWVLISPARLDRSSNPFAPTRGGHSGYKTARWFTTNAIRGD